MATTVLVVEDDDGIAAPLVRTLEREGYDVVHVDNGLEAVERADSQDVRLILLDLGLPDIDGLEVCRRIRHRGSSAAIMMLTARGGELDRVVGLDVGADDYLAKPLGLGELDGRGGALLHKAVRVGRAARPGACAAPAQRSRARARPRRGLLAGAADRHR